MGREIRRVPPNWEHPRDKDGEYISMCDEDYETAATRWVAEFSLWEQGQHPYQIRAREQGRVMTIRYYWEWNGNPPDEESSRPKFTEDPTWYQIYQTVSEGTPVFPPFETQEEMIEWLVTHGDGWDRPVSREAAEEFVRIGSVPSMVLGPEGLKTGVMACL